jgi:GNAT superfamily N-acetyltransferase
LASEIVVRDARHEDNDALIVLDRQCVMGGVIPLVFDRSPDFFARSRAYEWFRLCVAEEGGTIVGVGGVALKDLRVNGVKGRWAYFYDLRVRPTHRRRGVARQIADFLRHAVREAGIAGAYSWVVEGNTPSESFVEGRGSVPLRQCALALISASDEGKFHGFERITAPDGEVTSLLEATYRLHDFTPCWDQTMRNSALDRLVPLGWQGLYGTRVDGTWAACFGVWDYSRVMQLTVRSGASETPMRPFFLYPLGWRDPNALADGLRAARAMITASDGTLLLPYVPGDLLSAVIPADALRMGMILYVRGVPQARMQAGRLVFIDPTDL